MRGTFHCYDRRFRTLRLPIGEEIVFRPTGDVRRVGSGCGVPGNGGTLIRVPDIANESWGIRYMTRVMLGDDYRPDIDPWSLWEYNGETLRERFERIQVAQE